MPELPEVECLAQSIDALIFGTSLNYINFYRSDLRNAIPISRFKNIMAHGQIRRVFRKSKYLLMENDKGFGIFLLGMSGNILSYPSKDPQKDHTHAVFGFSVEGKDKPSLFLHFVDPRRFGSIDCCDHSELAQWKLFKDLGPEPLTKKNLGEYLYLLAQKKSVAIKSFLMDSKNVVGIGNIYASEILFESKVHPLRSANLVTQNEYRMIAIHTKNVLKKAIKAGGTTIRDYLSLNGKTGHFKVDLAVYGRHGSPCKLCKNPIDVIKQTGRSTFFCRKCQK